MKREFRINKSLSEYLPFLLVFLPVFIYWFNVTILTPGPFYQSYDPEAVYFIDSLAPFNGHTYNFIDHPGTPIEVIGTILLGTTYPFTGGHDFTQYHLAHPNIFILLTHSFLFVIYLVSAFMFYKLCITTLKKNRFIFAILLPLMYFGLHQLGFQSIITWSQNSFGFPFGTLLLVALFPLFNLEHQPIPGRKLLLLGLSAGILSSFQLYLLAWPISIAFVLFLYAVFTHQSAANVIKTVGRFVVYSVAGFFVGILPIVNKWGVLFLWVKNIIFHQGRLGAGTAGVLSLSNAKADLLSLISYAPGLFFVAGIFSILFIFISLVYLYKLKRHDPILSAIGMGLFAHMGLLLLMLVKHPGMVYLLSIASVAPVLALVDLKIAEDFSSETGTNYWIVVLPVALIILFTGWLTFSSLKDSISGHEVDVAEMNSIESAADQFLAEQAHAEGKQPRDLVVLYTFRAVDDCYALLYGINYTHLPIEDKLPVDCAKSYKLDKRTGDVTIAGEIYSLHDVDWDYIVTTRNILMKELTFLPDSEIIVNEVIPGYVIVENRK